MSMIEIERLASDYADCRQGLEDLTDAIQQARRRAVREQLPALRRRAADLSVARDALRAALEASPELFARPRTRSIAGVKVGYRKRKGRVSMADEQRTIGRIRERLPASQAELLIRVRESVDKNALADLSGADLKRLGVSIEDDADEVFIGAARSDLDQLVDALLADDEEQSHADAA